MPDSREFLQERKELGDLVSEYYQNHGYRDDEDRPQANGGDAKASPADAVRWASNATRPNATRPNAARPDGTRT